MFVLQFPLERIGCLQLEEAIGLSCKMGDKPYCSALVILLNSAKYVGDFDSTQALMHFRFG